MKKELLEKLTNTHKVLMQVKTSGDDSIAMAQGILMLRDCIQTAGALPDENSPKPQK